MKQERLGTMLQGIRSVGCRVSPFVRGAVCGGAAVVLILISWRLLLLAAVLVLLWLLLRERK